MVTKLPILHTVFTKIKINILTTCMYIIKVSINLLSITGFFYKLAFKLIDHETICRLAYCFIRSTYLSLNIATSFVQVIYKYYSRILLKYRRILWRHNKRGGRIWTCKLIDSYKRIPCSKQGLKCLQAKPREKWEHACLNQIMATSTGS